MRWPWPKNITKNLSLSARCTLTSLTLLGMLLLPLMVEAQESTSGEGEAIDSRPDLTRNKDRKAELSSEDYITDKKGRRVRVGFPLYDRVVVESLAQLSMTPQRAAHLTAPGVGFAWHKSLALDFNDEDIWWMLRHKLLTTDYRSVEPSGGARLRLSLLRGQYLRHDLSSFVVVPRGEDDLRLPANFDIAADYRLLEVEGENEDLFAPRAGFRLTRIETLSTALLMDFVRDESYRKRFAVGVAGWHTMTRLNEESDWHHAISPLSALKVLYGVDQKSGRARAYGEVACGAEIGLDAGGGMRASQWSWRCRALHELEWVFMSINDAPVSVPLEVRLDMPLAAKERGVVEATLGLRVGLMR